MHAYREAGFKCDRPGNAHRNSASKLARTPLISERVLELAARYEQADNRAVEVAIEKGAMERAEILLELSAIGRFNLHDMLVYDEVGRERLDLKRLSRMQMAAISEIQTDEESYVDEDRGPVRKVKTRVKFHPKLDALDKLLRIMGAYQDRLNINLSSDDLDAAIAKMEERLRLQSAGLDATVINQAPRLAEVDHS